MGAQIRVLRRRIKSAGAIKKITKAQELIATSRISKAQARVEAARPYADEMTRMLTTLADESTLDHPLLVARDQPKKAGVLVVSSELEEVVRLSERIVIMKDHQKVGEVVNGPDVTAERIVSIIAADSEQAAEARADELADDVEGESA